MAKIRITILSVLEELEEMRDYFQKEHRKASKKEQRLMDIIAGHAVIAYNKKWYNFKKITTKSSNPKTRTRIWREKIDNTKFYWLLQGRYGYKKTVAESIFKVISILDVIYFKIKKDQNIDDVDHTIVFNDEDVKKILEAEYHYKVLKECEK